VNGDIGRQERQQIFIRTVLRTVGDTRNPITLARVGSSAAKGVRVDTELGFFDVFSLARRLGSSEPETLVLPTVNARKGSAAVLELDNAAAIPILAQFGAPG
jgi:anionic cell wall polymer biosynthesis LytR-Cps2A-Psr (LCP) family protein